MTSDKNETTTKEKLFCFLSSQQSCLTEQASFSYQINNEMSLPLPFSPGPRHTKDGPLI